MDSLTQVALGAAVGFAIGGRRLGRKAMVWGGLLGALPDLDVFVPMGDAVADFTYHRSWSHSLFVMALATPPLAWCIRQAHGGSAEDRWRWWGLVLGTLWTHALLDAFTVYGTQLWWPLPHTPTSWSTVFIIDPLYTLPLLVGCWLGWRRYAERPGSALLANALGLLLSTGYLGATVAAKFRVEQAVERAIQARGLHGARYLTTPMPLNALLWRVVVFEASRERYHEGFYSLVADDELRLRAFDATSQWPERLPDPSAYHRLRWFTDGFCAMRRVDDRIVVTDLRMGAEPDYVFEFTIAEFDAAGRLHSVRPRGQRRLPDWRRLPRIWARIFDASIELQEPANF